MLLMIGNLESLEKIFINTFANASRLIVRTFNVCKESPDSIEKRTFERKHPDGIVRVEIGPQK